MLSFLEHPRKSELTTTSTLPVVSRKIMTRRGQFKEDGASRCFGVWKQGMEERCWYKPRKPRDGLFCASGANCPRQTNSLSGCHGLLKNSENKRKPKNVGMLKQVVSSAKVNFSSWNSDHFHLESVVQQFLRSRCYTGQKHPAGRTSSSAFTEQILLSMHCEHGLLSALIGRIFSLQISSLQTISSSSRAPLSYIYQSV